MSRPELAIIDRIAEALKIQTSQLSLVCIDTGKFNTSFFVEVENGEDAVLRIAPPDGTGLLFYERQMMRQEPELAERLARDTDVPIAPVLFEDFSREICQRDYLLLKRLPGEPLSSRGYEMNTKQIDHTMEQLGAALKKVHALEGPSYGYGGSHEPMEPCRSWKTAFGTMWEMLIEDVVASGGYNHSLLHPLANLAHQYEDLFSYDGPPRLLHMDVWSQNVLVEPEGTLTGLIDWDRALYGDPEIEFAVLSYCNMDSPSFWKGYGSEPETTTESKARQLFYMLYEHQKYIVINMTREDDSSRAAEYSESSLSMLRSLAEILSDYNLLSLLEQDGE